MGSVKYMNIYFIDCSVVNTENYKDTGGAAWVVFELVASFLENSNLDFSSLTK